MAFLNASGSPVATKPVTLQVDLPCEAVSDSSIAAINWMAVITAAIGFILALKSGDPTAIAAALQALIKAITGQ